ncbi:MAG: sigma-70 family RNA polymerase sigma factor [Lachnospiraceae bacterium]|nr:sigma-70 family RNA polymerase sigma factor [Lachnospiraceae bacterium]
MNTLIRDAKNGDYEALGKLYEACRKKGLSVASRYVKNDSDSEDMYQDAFLKAMENIDRFDENHEFQPWLDTIIANTCKDFLRKKRPINFTDMSDEENEFVDTISGSDEEALPESSYLRGEMLKIVDDIVDTLPAEQKQATLLFYFKDYSVKQVASLQHVSEDTVKSRLNYSRKKMALATADYEKKHGIRVSFACLVPAVMLLYFKNSANAAHLEGELEALSTAAGAGAAALASEAGSASVGSTLAKAGAVAVKTGFSAKVAGFIAVGALALTGAGFGIHHLINADSSAVSTDEQIVSVQASENGKDSGISDSTEDNKETASVELTEEEKRAAALKETIKAAKVGDFIEIGTFEQDGDTANGTEPIEWMVLADEDGKKLLLSKYILMSIGDMMKFPGDGVNYTWKECGIREYLNGDFYESAFTEEERAQITETEIRSTWEDYSSLGELLDVKTISWEFVGQTFSRDIGKIVTTDRIFIPDFDEDFVRYMKVHKDIYENFGTDMLAKATPASGIENFSYTQQAYDWEKDYTGYNDFDPENVNLDESLIGKEFGNYILRTGMSGPCPTYSEDGSSTGNHVISACYYVVTGSDAAIYYPPYWITEFPFHTKTLGIRPMMWVTTE